ncbi:hypothetical protein HaLaN_17508 [Haematococcus lacustris]|uniref:Uncharacterized protein n=1 Tax=Haematococcus lacustris TaxID=44745 RepID=A0A699ZCG8_HAELA|nr:hypothetical protein HaLaN_17508 [Haematococcus lacustris]
MHLASWTSSIKTTREASLRCLWWMPTLSQAPPTWVRPCRRKRSRTHLSCSQPIVLVVCSGISDGAARAIEPEAASEDRRGASESSTLQQTRFSLASHTEQGTPFYTLACCELTTVNI